MDLLTRRLPIVLLALLPLAATGQTPAQSFPEDHRALAATIPYAAMQGFLKSVDGKSGVSVSVEATSPGGHNVYLVHLSRGGTPAFRILFYAQQHGNEVSSKDAMLYLIRDISRKPELLPADVDLWIFPMMNPDGAEAGKRRNGAGVDLNRDHMVLEQPEVQALYRTIQRVRPHLAVDCHEFTSDDEDRTRHGWVAWPEITMDGLDNPLFDPALVAAARRWVDEGDAVATAAGHPYYRYTVGGLPPDEEQRHSAPDVDSGVNGAGMYGCLSFIIEAAVKRASGTTSVELGSRVDAYLTLLWRFVNGDGHRAEDLATVERARNRRLPAFIPTNYLWMNVGPTVTEFPVRELATGKKLLVPTENMMTTVAVKAAVPTPLGYALEPSVAQTFASLLDRHAIPYQRLAAPRRVTAEACTLLRVEDDWDEVYSRYEGRQVMRRSPPAVRELPAGSLWVPLEGEAAMRAALVLEPTMMYGLYQYPRFWALVGPKGAIPVLRVIAEEK